MNKKQTIKKTAAMLLGITIALGATGCEFITTNKKEDLKQTVANVNIQSVLEEDAEYSDIADEFKSLGLSGKIKKRELVSYYLSVGYYYVENYGYTYKDTFDMLLNALINREILVQHAAAHFLNTRTETLTNEAFTAYKAALDSTAEENKRNDIVALKYLLSEGDVTNTKDYDLVVYTLKKNINDSIDSIETSSYITADDEHSHGTARTTPTGLDTEKEDYYTTNYEVYTGRKALSSCGEYEKVEGSTVSSRQKAYNAFLTNLQEYDLISSSGKDVEDTSDVTNLEYYYVELVSLLEQRLIDKYYKEMEGTVYDALDSDYVNKKYEELFNQNKKAYENDPVAFASAMDSASADSFLTYAPTGTYEENGETKPLTFGYVYNILLPFSAQQNVEIEQAQGMGLKESDLYKVRRNIAANIVGKDLRSSWISTDDHVNYSYQKANEKYYFFQDSVEDNDRYEKLTQYAGTYPFQGAVSEELVDGEYDITEDAGVKIDEFMNIFEKHINDTVGKEIAAETPNDFDYDSDSFVTGKGDDKETDYGKFIYYTGKVDFDATQTAAGFFDPSTEQYKALSAVNELMFAYSTDTGCLNTYMGYSVSPYGTNFVPEFEEAAQYVVEQGVGSYAVCLTDYGWHIVYCSFSYDANYMGENGWVYGEYKDAEKETKGTFSNLFYEYLKDSAYANYSTESQSATLKKYANSAKRYKDNYKDLYDFDNY